MDLEENPDVVADDPVVGFKCAAWYWNTKNLNKWADVNTKEGFDQVTQIVNGCVTCPFTNQPQRTVYWQNCKRILGC